MFLKGSSEDLITITMNRSYKFLNLTQYFSILLMKESIQQPDYKIVDKQIDLQLYLQDMGNFCKHPQQPDDHPTTLITRSVAAEQTVIDPRNSRSEQTQIKNINSANSVIPQSIIPEQFHSDEEELETSIIKEQIAFMGEAKDFKTIYLENGHMRSNNYCCLIAREALLAGKDIFIAVKWINLTSLGISREPFGNKGCLYLTKIFLPQLSKLGLVNCNIQQAGISHLSKKPWKKLTQLYLTSNKIANALYHFSKMSLPSIKYINLQNNRIIQQEIDFLLISIFPSIDINLTWNKIENVKKKEKRRWQLERKFKLTSNVLL